MHCNIMANIWSSEELNRFRPNPATQAYFLLLTPGASEAFYSCLYQGFYAYKMASSAKDRDGRKGQKKCRHLYWKGWPRMVYYILTTCTTQMDVKMSGDEETVKLYIQKHFFLNDNLYKIFNIQTAIKICNYLEKGRSMAATRLW